MNQPQVRQFITAAKGEGFPNSDGSSRQAAIAELRPGEVIRLIPEPHNRRDSKAVALFTTGDRQIGYLSRDVARLVAAAADRGQTATACVERTQCRTRPGSPRIVLLRVTWCAPTEI